MSAAELFMRHRKIARALAAEFTLPGQTRDDVLQEAMIGLWEAARSWDSSREASFPTFANVVVRNHLGDCLRTATRLKHRILSDAVRVIRDEDAPAAVGVEDAHGLLQRMTEVQLTPLERQVFVGRLNDRSSQQIADEIGADKKTVDNAMFRVKTKMREVR